MSCTIKVLNTDWLFSEATYTCRSWEASIVVSRDCYPTKEKESWGIIRGGRQRIERRDKVRNWDNYRIFIALHTSFLALSTSSYFTAHLAVQRCCRKCGYDPECAV